MGKVSIITKEQQIILDEIKQNNYIRSNFYFTGGTALSSVYIQHRYSEDLDFFIPERFDNQIIGDLMDEWSKKHQFTIQSRFVEVVYVFNLMFKNGIPLKVDFGYYPYQRVEKGTEFEGITVDSLLDIAINKLLTISQRDDVKDFVDLYFLLEQFSIWDLLEGIRVKFRQKKEPFLLSADFLKVEDFENMPRMIKPLTLQELREFFREKAKEIGKMAVE